MAREAFPVGASVTLDALHLDPYPLYARLVREEPVSWVPAADMWFITSAELCRGVLRDEERFAVGFERSPVRDVLGEHMMSVDGERARRYKRAHQGAFLPGSIREHMEGRITASAQRLVDSFADRGEVELRSGFASRLPVMVMLELLGLSAGDELLLRRWYDALEAALANTTFEPRVRELGHAAAAEFHAHVRAEVSSVRADRRPGTLLDDLVHAAPGGSSGRLTDDEIVCNAGIVLFGGISTVEALILDAVWALGRTDGALQAAVTDPTTAHRAIHETIRWLGPVQIAHRQATTDVEVGGVGIRRGDMVACVLAAANRDPRVFDDPDEFRPDRLDSHQHLGFGAGQHHCLGLHLALAEGRIALTELVAALPGLRLDPYRPSAPVGGEFRRPEHLWAVWDTVRA